MHPLSCGKLHERQCAASTAAFATSAPVLGTTTTLATYLAATITVHAPPAPTIAADRMHCLHCRGILPRRIGRADCVPSRLVLECERPGEHSGMHRVPVRSILRRRLD